MKLSTLFILLYSCFIFAQSKSLLDKIVIDGSTKIIGMYPQYDKSATYKTFNFYIDDANVIKSLVNKLVYTDEGKNIIERNDFEIKILQGNNIIQHWAISPAYSTIRIDGVSYKFDIKLLEELSKKYPFDYKFYEKEFSNSNEYNTYLTELKKDENFLFDYEPDFEFEGKFQIEFPKNSQFTSPKAISVFLEPKILAIVNKDQYNLTYIVDEYNRNNRNQFTMTIEGSKDIYEKLQIDNLSQKNWKNNRPAAMFFIKIK
jgi:hypothetical protein